LICVTQRWEGVTVELVRVSDGMVVASTFSNGQGIYGFDDVAAGTYTLVGEVTIEEVVYRDEEGVTVTDPESSIEVELILQEQ
jgi:urease gamma subunit